MKNFLLCNYEIKKPCTKLLNYNEFRYQYECAAMIITLSERDSRN